MRRSDDSGPMLRFALAAGLAPAVFSLAGSGLGGFGGALLWVRADDVQKGCMRVGSGDVESR
jgi:hypothetical protein